jgi:hypothetical protein
MGWSAISWRIAVRERPETRPGRSRAGILRRGLEGLGDAMLKVVGL